MSLKFPASLEHNNPNYATITKSSIESVSTDLTLESRMAGKSVVVTGGLLVDLLLPDNVFEDQTFIDIVSDGTPFSVTTGSVTTVNGVNGSVLFESDTFVRLLNTGNNTWLYTDQTISQGNVVWVSKTGNDTTGTSHSLNRPFLTVTAAQSAASSGDTILVLPGDYSGETALAGKDGVTYQGLDGAILPGFNVSSAITVKGSGLCQSLTCNNAGAVMDMPGMDTVAFITCFGGTQTAGNAGTYILCFGGTQQTAGNAGTYIRCDGGTQTAGNAGTYIECVGGTQTAGNAGTSISCASGTQTVGNAGTFIGCTGGTQATGNAGGYIVCSDGNQTIHLTNQTHNGASFAPVYLSGSGSLNLYGDTSTSTESGGTVVDIENTWSGNLFIDGLKLKATTVATNEATTGIKYGTGVTGTVNLKDCTIITAEDGTGTAKAIDAPSAQPVYIQGTLNTTHAVDANITLAGGSISTNTNYA